MEIINAFKLSVGKQEAIVWVWIGDNIKRFDSRTHGIMVWTRFI
jgi:hypothetical protein